MSISFELLFMTVSTVIFIFLRDKTFKYYALYNFILVLYLLSRSDSYFFAVENFVTHYIGDVSAAEFMHVLNFYIQIVFYTFYSIFALYFLDLNKLVPRYFLRVLWILRGLSVLFLLFGIVCYLTFSSDLYVLFYTVFYLPVMLGVFVITVFKALRYSGRHKYIFLTGVSAYVLCAFIAYMGSMVPQLGMKNPIDFFYLGIILETVFFSFGLAYRIKIINDNKNRLNQMMLEQLHQQQISKLQGLVEGEERERRRWAEELHDGVSGDLTAIRMNLHYLSSTDHNREHAWIIDELTQAIDKSCMQLRELSHNLSPSTVTNHGLQFAVSEYCRKIQNSHGLKIKTAFPAGLPALSHAVETHLYRIIQELVNNIVKHARATKGKVAVVCRNGCLILSVKDNGQGFTLAETNSGIGLSNIDSRARFLNASLKVSSSSQGTRYTLQMRLSDLSLT